MAEPSGPLVYGVDLGGTKLHGAIADPHGTIVAEKIVATDPRGGFHVVQQIADVCRDIACERGIAADRIEVCSIGVPGSVDPRSGRLAIIPNIDGVEGMVLRDQIMRRMPVQALVHNDVNMAALGEQRFGEGRGLDSFVFIAVGTGIGMGIIDEGRLVVGAHGGAGEISGLPLGADAFDASTFKSGALETAISSAAIRGRYHALGGALQLTVRDIFDRMAAGDPIAHDTIDHLARILAQTVLAVSAVLDPQCVVLGGSIGARPELLERLRHQLDRCMPLPVPCVVSKLGNRAGLLGAIATGLQQLSNVGPALRLPRQGQRA